MRHYALSRSFKGCTFGVVVRYPTRCRNSIVSKPVHKISSLFRGCCFMPLECFDGAKISYFFYISKLFRDFLAKRMKSGSKFFTLHSSLAPMGAEVPTQRTSQNLRWCGCRALPVPRCPYTGCRCLSRLGIAQAASRLALLSLLHRFRPANSHTSLNSCVPLATHAACESQHLGLGVLHAHFLNLQCHL